MVVGIISVITKCWLRFFFFCGSVQVHVANLAPAIINRYLKLHHSGWSCGARLSQSDSERLHSGIIFKQVLFTFVSTRGGWVWLTRGGARKIRHSLTRMCEYPFLNHSWDHSSNDDDGPWIKTIANYTDCELASKIEVKQEHVSTCGTRHICYITLGPNHAVQ